MCGRYTQTINADALMARFGVERVLLDVEPRYNVAPTQTAPVVAQEDGKRTLKGMRWGLVPPWAKDIKIGAQLLNARAETLAEKAAFRTALRKRRCLVPASGFYEWQKTLSGKQPFHIHLPEYQPFAFAGLWEEWKQPDGTPLHTYTIITTGANSLMAPIHDRMPVILRPEDEARWLELPGTDPVPLLELLRPYPEGELIATPVSSRVGKVGNDDAECIAPLVTA